MNDSWSTRCLASTAQLDALEPQWRDLEARSPAPALFSCFDYVSTAWRHFSGSEDCSLHVLAIHRPDGQLAAIAPFRITRGRWLGTLPTRTVHWLATWEGDRPELLHDGQEAMCWDQVQHWFGSQFRGWDVLSLAERPDGWRPAGSLQRAAHLDQWTDSVGYEIDLTPGFDAYIASRSKSVRANWNKRRRRLLEGEPAACVEACVTPAAMPAAVARFIAVEQAGWKGTAGMGVGKDEAHQGFYTELCGRLADRGQCRIHFLTLAGQDIAASLDFICGGIVRARHVAYRAEQASHSPGTVLTLEMLRNFAQEGLCSVDLMGLAPASGVDRNKLDWSTSRYETRTWLCFRRSGRLWPLYFLRQLRKRLRRA